MTDTKVLRTLRAQAWARAKGELDAVLATFWESELDEYEALRNVVEGFTKYVDDTM